MSGAPLSDLLGIKALDMNGLASLVRDLGQPPFRATQLARWLYHDAVRSYADMSNLPAALRDRLDAEVALPFPKTLETQLSADGTRKYLLELADGATVEAVGLPTEDRLTVCFSTQAGCPMGCVFCATGASGFTRDLAPGEMVDQLSVVALDFGRRVTNAVAMGQGEPFANYDALLGALRIANSPDGTGIGARHITVSTCGIVSGIRRFADEPEQFTLAVSLHSAVQETRDRIMPGLKGIGLRALRDAVSYYTDKSGRRCSFEYALAEGVNDSQSELRALIGYCQGLLVHVNLIPVNAAGPAGLRRPPAETVEMFVAGLRGAGIEASVRAERGADIDAACGQLRQRKTP